MTRSATILGGAIAAIGLLGLAENAIEASVAMEALDTSFRAAAGSAREGAEELEFVRQESERLGLNFRSTADSARLLIGSLEGTSLEGEQTRQIFLGVAEAGTAMRLTSEQMSGAINALSQIAGKGVVSMEELRQQLGERIPGAFRIAAEAMGVTTAEMDKLVSSGQLLATDFLPRFAAELRERFGPSAQEAATTFQAASNRMGNAFERLLANMGRVITQSPLVVGAMNAMAGAMETMSESSERLTQIERLRQELATLEAQGGLRGNREARAARIASLREQIAALEELQAVQVRQAQAVEEVRKTDEKARNESRRAAETALARAEALDEVAKAAVKANEEMAAMEARGFARLNEEVLQLNEERFEREQDLNRQRMREFEEMAAAEAAIFARTQDEILKLNKDRFAEEQTLNRQRQANLTDLFNAVGGLLRGFQGLVQSSITALQGFISQLGGALQGIGSLLNAIPGLGGVGGILGLVGQAVGPLVSLGKSIAGLFGGGGGEDQFRLRGLQAGFGGTQIQFETRGISNELGRSIADRIIATSEALFDSLEQSLAQFSPELRAAFEGPIASLIETFNSMGDWVEFDGSGMQREFERFLEGMSETFQSLFGEIMAAGQEIARLRGERERALRGFAGTRRTLEEAFLRPDQIIARRQSDLQQLLAQFRAGTPEQQAVLGQRIRSSVDELFRLGLSSTQPGQAEALQQQLLGVLDEVESTVGGNFDAQIALQESQVASLLNIQTIGEQQVVLLQQIAQSLVTNAGAIGPVTPEFLRDIRIGLAQQRRFGQEVF